jgi:hypothetical protein
MAAEASQMSEPRTGRSEAELLFDLVRARYEGRLAAEELEAVRAGVGTIVDAVKALRAVRLENGDGPLLPHVPPPPPGL